ncbi:hypothetical protein EUGRSUZ_H03673 [Eucalyptus grandis]|uniref:Uncharacterized protein n=2 Tax=Eucalyptus grandis TaxID=71139 RepID=A0ACC3JX04_EUCGR|nr:hypothetical protein EUGRSUZ_H03673 [Eucalyptus grandis]
MIRNSRERLTKVFTGCISKVCNSRITYCHASFPKDLVLHSIHFLLTQVHAVASCSAAVNPRFLFFIHVQQQVPIFWVGGPHHGTPLARVFPLIARISIVPNICTRTRNLTSITTARLRIPIVAIIATTEDGSNFWSYRICFRVRSILH